MLVIWSRLDAVDEGERLRIEARLESLTRHAPVARVQIEGIPPEDGGLRETVRITGKVEGMQVVAMREEASLGQALEGALRAFEESILRMSERWAARESDKKLAAAGGGAGGGRPIILELGADRPAWGTRLFGWLPRLPARSLRFRRISGSVAIVALLVALAAEECRKPEVAGFSAVATGASPSFSAESSRASGPRSLPPVSRPAPGTPTATPRPLPRSFGARAQSSPDDAGDDSARRPAAQRRTSRFSAESEDAPLQEQAEPVDESQVAQPGVLRRRP